MDGDLGASQPRKIAIAIAVADSVPRAYLGGAINGAKHFLEWAQACGYTPTLICDEDAPVTMPRLRAEMEGALGVGKGALPPIYRIIIYFAGHGFIREAEEGLWLLSDWSDELRAVAFEVLKRRLTQYGAQQVTIISDACGSLPSDIDIMDLVPDAVLRRGPHPVNPSMVVDKFIAAQDGRQAFMIPGADPSDDRCLFTGVVLEGLWGQREAAFSRLLTGRVTSRSLGTFVQAEAARRAEEYGLVLNPKVSPTFPEGDDYYYVKGEDPPPPAPRPWPSKLAGAPPIIVRELGASLQGQLLQDEIALEEDDEIMFLGVGRNLPYRDVPRHAELPEMFNAVFAIGRSSTRSAWSWPEIRLEKGGDERWWRISGDPRKYKPRPPVPILVDYGGDRVAAFTSFPGSTADLTMGARGVERIVYRPWRRPRTVSASTEKAFRLLEAGGLTLEMATDLAVDLRQFKHEDVMLGAICAYLYDAIGDIDSIRRMASYYASAGQPIPFDIALLAELPAQMHEGLFRLELPHIAARKPRTDAEEQYAWTTSEMRPTSGVVAGLWPWLRQGWTYMTDPHDAEASLVLPGVNELARHLQPARFTTLNGDGAKWLADRLGLEEKSLKLGP